ncbi:MAG: TetR/AcrR family transcriptional regulator [Anaerolineales bacterium]|jgi:AcrR family transcriptional regulator
MDEKKRDRLSRPGQFIGNEGRHKGNRRRGEILEAAILQAAWDELSDAGYTQLTMEGVAARAKTNKAVLYRRWANKKKLVIAAFQKYLPRPVNNVPDTGDLRNDVLVLLLGIARPLQAIGAKTIHGLMAERLGTDLISLLPQMRQPGTEDKFSKAIMTILKNAELRGEVNLGKISPRVISLPVDLLRYEILITQEPIPDKMITGIVDDIFLPLVHAQPIIFK